MPDDSLDGSSIPGFQSLRRLFAGTLMDAKQSAYLANLEIKQAKKNTEKLNIITARFGDWVDGCSSAIRTYFPQIVDLGNAYRRKLSGDPIIWAEDKTWDLLFGFCRVRKIDGPGPRPCEDPFPKSDAVNWWLEVAISGSPVLEIPKTWRPPRWLANGPREFDRLLAALNSRLSVRFFGVLDDEKERARVRLALQDAPKRPINLFASGASKPATPGRKPSRNPEFVVLAAELWITSQDDRGRVSQERLRGIAAQLDASSFSKPSDHLERRAAEQLNTHNRQFGNSPKRIRTWTDIVTRSGEVCIALRSAMRKLLCRCAKQPEIQLRMKSESHSDSLKT